MCVLLHLVADRTGRRGELDREGNVLAVDANVPHEAERDDVATQVRILTWERAARMSSGPIVTVRLARTIDDLTRHGDGWPAMAAAHRAAGKRRQVEIW